MSTSSVPREWTSTWELFDEHKSGVVAQSDVKHIMRSLGRRHTEAEFRELLKLLPDPVPYHAFVQLMQKPYNGPTEDDLLTALRAFDSNDSGVLRMSELVTLLTSLGEKMPEMEVRELLSSVPLDDDGKVRIDDLVRYLCSPTPSITAEMEEMQQRLAAQQV